MNLTQMQSWLQQICTQIQMPSPAHEKIMQTLPTLHTNEIWETAQKLTIPQLSAQSQKALQALLHPDVDGWKMLTVMLATAQQSWTLYQTNGWEESVIWETLATFSRFVREHFSETGRYGFDRDFWTWRQLCGQIVRLGSLEYESTTYQGPAWESVQVGQPCIMVHIPSDANLHKEAVANSLHLAKAHWSTEPFFCDSWILAPSLDTLLPSNSNLRDFRSRFICLQTDCDNTAFIKWVFQDTKLPPELWPTHTTLQKNIKQHVQNGGSIGTGFAYLSQFA